jgi:hypothetical protein
MRVFIRAVGDRAHGRSSLSRAGRFFSFDSPAEVEVVDDEPPQVDVGKGIMRPDPARMGRKAFEVIKNDPAHFSVTQDGDTDAALSSGAVQAARASAQALAGRVTDLEVEVARLRAENEAKDKTIADLRADNEAKADKKKGKDEPKV